MTKQFWTGLIVGLVVSAVVGGIIGISMMGARATVQPPDLEAYIVNQLKNLKIPKAAPLDTPIEMTDESLAQGGEHFNHHCAVCHDLGGNADSTFAKAFYPPVADLTSEHVQRYSDEQLKWIVENGIRYTGMPGWEGFIDSDTQWKIVYYMRALADREKAEQLKAVLEESGKWKIEAPSAGDHHHGEPGAEEQAHEHGEAHQNHHETEAEPEGTHGHGEHEAEQHH